MAYSNIDQAVTIPQNQQLAGFAQQLYAQGERDRRIAQQMAEDDRQRQDTLARYVGQEFNNKDYMTGTVADPLINQRIADQKQKYLSMLSQNPKMSNADLQFMMQKDIGDLSVMSSGLKNGNANIQAQAKAFSKYPGVDSNAIEQMARARMLYDIDPKTGAKKMKDPASIDYSKDYVSEVIMEHPEIVSKGDQGLRAYLKTFQSQDLGKTIKREVKGVTVETKYDAKVPPYMELVTDKDGVGTGVKVRGEVIPGFKNPDGSPLEVVDSEVYQTFNTDPASSIVLQKMFKDWNKNQKTPIDNTSEQADLVKRKLLYDYLGKNGVYEFKPGYSSTNNSIVDKRDYGIPLQSYRAGLSDAAKLLKENQKLEGLDTGLLMRGLGGEATVLEGAPTVEVNGRSQYDMTSTIGGMKVGYDKERKPIYATGVFVDPVTKKITLQTADGMKEYAGKDIRRMIKQVSEYNGVTLDKADKTLNLFMDNQGNYKGKQNTEDLAALQFQQDRQKQESRKTLQATATQFESSKDITQLDAVKGQTLKDGTVIKEFGERGAIKQRLGMDPYYITLQDGSTKTFKTAFLLSDYIKKNLK